MHTFKLAASRTITELSEACERYEAYRDLVNLVKGRRIDAVVCPSLAG